jgi:hypothetical protein
VATPVVKPAVPCDSELVFFGTSGLSRAPVPDCTGYTGCVQTLICSQNQLCWDAKDHVCYSEYGDTLPITVATLSTSNITFNIASPTLQFSECVPGRFVPSTGLYTVPQTAFYRLDAQVTLSINTPVSAPSASWEFLLSWQSVNLGTLSAQESRQTMSIPVVGSGTQMSIPVSTMFVGNLQSGDVLSATVFAAGMTGQILQRAISIYQL